MLELRQYQREAVNSIGAYFAQKSGHPLIVIPTGGGKSLIQATFLKESLASWQGQRFLCLTHRKELIQQNYDELRQIWPMAPAGVYSAGIGRRDTDADIIFAGIQSVAKKADRLGRFSLVIIDEAHLLGPDSESSYRTFLRDAMVMNPQLRVIGMTATPMRLGTGLLTEGEAALFTDIAYEAKVADLVKLEFLAPLVSKRGLAQFDLSEVHVRGGEFIPGELSKAMDERDVLKEALDEVVAMGKDRKSWLLFCCGVDHAYHVAAELTARGIPTGCVTGETPKAERDAIIDNFKAGRLQALTNADVLTTGFNAPGVDLLVMLRPTKSAGLYVQLAGRGMRRAPGKDNCLVLDYAQNTLRHGPVDCIELTAAKKQEGGDAPAKYCPECNLIIHARIMVCPGCAYEFPPNLEPKHVAKAVDAPIMASEAELPETIDVLDMSYSEWTKRDNPDGPKTLCVSYIISSFAPLVREWVCVSHPDGSFPMRKALAWWRQRSDEPMPQAAEAAIMGNRGLLKEPAQIMVKRNGKFLEIVQHIFRDPCTSCKHYDSGFCHKWEQDVPEAAQKKGCEKHEAVERVAEVAASDNIPF